MVSTGWVDNRRRAITGIWRCSTNGPREVWGEDPSTRDSSSAAPGRAWWSTVAPVNGSWVVPGLRPAGRSAPGQGRLAGGLTVSDLRAANTRSRRVVRGAGLRGTGSNTLVVKGCLVPPAPVLVKNKRLFKSIPVREGWRLHQLKWRTKRTKTRCA